MINKKKLPKWIRWYILGDYHCDECPYCWGGEYMPGCDEYEDAGCYIRKGLYDNCRLLPPIRFILGFMPKRKNEYAELHRYDGDYEYFEKQYNERKKLAEVLTKFGLIESAEDKEGFEYSVCHLDIYDEIRDIFTPPFKTFKERKKEIKAEQRKRLADKIKPFLPKRWW